MTEQFTNGAQTTLNGAINNSVGSLTVTSAAGFPTSGDFRIIIAAEGGNKDEILLVTGVSGTTFTVTRAYEAIADGTQVAQSHSNGATLAHVLTAGSLRAAALPQGFIGARAYNSAVQSITDNTSTALTFDSEEFDSDTFHSTSSNTSRMTIPAGLGGKYILTASAYFSGFDADGTRLMFFKKNGSELRGESRIGPASNSGQTPNPTVVVDLNAGDYVEVWVYQNSGAAMDVGHGSSTTAQATFSIVKLDSGKVGSGIGASVYSNATTNINDATFTAVAFTNEDFDTDNFHDNATNNTRMTIPTGLGGLYLLRGNVEWDTNATGDRIVTFFKNGSDTSRGWTRDTAVAAGSGQPATAVLNLAAGDYVEMRAYQNSGTTRTVGSNGRTNFSIIRLDSGASTNRMVSIRLAAEFNNTNATMTVDSTSYIQTGNLDFYFDFDQFPATHFLITCWGGSSTAGQTISAQLATIASPTTPISAAGNDLSAMNDTVTNRSSGWIPITNRPSGLTYVGVVLKGSNSTVDFLGRWVQIDFKIA
jgi:hypothetical protein